MNNPTHGPMLHLPPSALSALHRALATDRAPDQAAQAARRLGFETGEGFYHAFQRWLGQFGEGVEQLPPERFWERLGEFFAELGWGRLEFESLHAGVGALSSTEWAESAAEPSARHPVCHLTTGILADVLGRVAGDDVAVMEVECRARGDARCRFLLGGMDALQRVHGTLREGGSVPDALAQLG
jgi:hypothetical protein